MRKIAILCVYLLIKESPHADSRAKGSFTKQISYPSIAKSDKIGKISHLAFSHENMGADILEKLSLTLAK